MKTFSYILASSFLIAFFSFQIVRAHENHEIGATEHPAIKARHELMEDTAFAAKQAGKMVKGATAYDPAKAELAMRLIGSAASHMGNYFTKESMPQKGSKSEASPKIWKNMKDFLSKIEDFKVSSGQAIKVAGKGKEPFKAGFMKVIKSCKSCHETYRVDKD